MGILSTTEPKKTPPIKPITIDGVDYFVLLIDDHWICKDCEAKGLKGIYDFTGDYTCCSCGKTMPDFTAEDIQEP